MELPSGRDGAWNLDMNQSSLGEYSSLPPIFIMMLYGLTQPEVQKHGLGRMHNRLLKEMEHRDPCPARSSLDELLDFILTTRQGFEYYALATLHGLLRSSCSCSKGHQPRCIKQKLATLVRPH